MNDILLNIPLRFAESDNDDSPFPEQSITIHTGGLLISGRLISRKKYMQAFLDGQIQSVIDRAVASGELQPGIVEGPDFMHLEDAHFFVPGQLPIPSSGAGVMWRGRLASIDGFTIGELRVGPV